MKQDSIDDLKKRVAELEARNKKLQEEISLQIKVEQVIVAAGLLSKEKFREAEDLVRDI